MLTAGTDRAVRLWDLENPADSQVIASPNSKPGSGGVSAAARAGHGGSVFSCVTAEDESGERDLPLYVITEEEPPSASGVGGGATDQLGTSGAGPSPAKLSASSKLGATPVHTDAILDMVVFTARHQRFLATCGRDGVINVMA